MDLSPRLERILFYIPEVPILADIGTDHGQIAIEAVQRKRARMAVATDKSAASLDKARKAVEASLLQGKISLRVGDGLTTLRTGEAQCIVIAGMGGKQIVKLLDAGGPIWANARLILQPNRDVAAVREWLFSDGVILSTESLVRERGRSYTILVAARGPQHMRDMAYHVPGWTYDDLHLVGPHLLREGGADVAAYYADELKKAQAALKKMPKSSEDRPEQEALIAVLSRAVEKVG